jgi:hypothetical protein
VYSKDESMKRVKNFELSVTSELLGLSSNWRMLSGRRLHVHFERFENGPTVTADTGLPQDLVSI